MNICKHISTQLFLIMSPRWRDKVVLLKDQKLSTFNKVVFTGTDGKSMGTEPYIISGKKAKTYPVEDMATRDGRVVKMRAVSLDALELLEYPDHCEHSD